MKLRFSLRSLLAVVTVVCVVIGVSKGVGSWMIATYGQTAMWWDELLEYIVS